MWGIPVINLIATQMYLYIDLGKQIRRVEIALMSDITWCERHKLEGVRFPWTGVIKWQLSCGSNKASNTL